MIHYSKDFELNKALIIKDNTTAAPAAVSLAAANLNPDLATTDTLKTLIYAIKKDEILLRINNMEDIFDKKADSHSIDLTAFARDLFIEANPSITNQTLLASVEIAIEQMTLSGAANYEKRMRANTAWKSNEALPSLAQSAPTPPAQPDKASEDKALGKYEVRLEP